MDGFFDLHCHILPHVDDGAQNDACALDMLRVAYNDGIRNICFTPHRNPYQGDEDGADYETPSDAYRRFLPIASEKFPDMRFSLGSEIMYYSGCMDDIRRKRCSSLCGGRYLLLEFPYAVSCADILRAVRQTLSNGYRPVIAHVERYDCLYREPKRLFEITADNCTLQLNASVFAERPRRFLRHTQYRFLHTIFKGDLPFIVASDAHDTQIRVPKLAFAYRQICDNWGARFADRAFFELPAEIFDSSPL